jgi:hypothetical protein
MTETRRLPPVKRKERSYLRGLFTAYEQGRGKMPPPWIIASRFKDREDEKILAAVVALHPVRPSKSASQEEPWLIRAVLRAAVDSPLTLTRLSVEHFFRPDVEVTGHVLHLIPVAEIRNRAQAWLRAKEITLSAFAEAGEKVSAADRRWARMVAAEAGKLPLNRGRKGYPADHYRRIALRAIDLFNVERRRDVLKALASEEERPYQTIREWIRQARDRGLLAPSKQGRTDFRPGPNLYRKAN